MTTARMRRCVLALLLLALGCFGGIAPAQAQEQWNPIADPKAVVVQGDKRFTVLTPQLVRLEWAEDGKFEDRASFVFVNRRLPAPKFTTTVTSGGALAVQILRTESLAIIYNLQPGPFTAQNLRIEFALNGKQVTWTPGVEDKANLGGTIRTLDGVRGDAPLDQGLLSRDGWVLVDDTDRPLLDGSDWPWVMLRPSGQRQDWYFFAYGHDYKRALSDFTGVAGKIPLPPRFVFGAWWSRYWAYTDEEFMDLVRQFQTHDVPLDVLVIDMDWHPTFGVKWWENRKDQAGHTLGWTGYTWNKLYFPDPPRFLSWVHEQGLKATLNMHPASGVQPHEEQYAEMARAMGMDPASGKYVPFDLVDKKFAENYFKILHHPLEKQGVDFFWLDWQQQHTTKLAGVSPTWWLNYTHFTDMERRGKRGLLFHRWGGLGNHRYQIGFSGDTISVWESLAFQPYFTSTASNVLYGYWSHDIGGHMRAKLGAKPEVGKPVDPDYPELYTRWIQFGIFSPVLRTHTTKDPTSERRIWAYPAEYAAVMRDAFLLRYSLIPYIYTAARRSYDTGVSLCRPMYYDWPGSDQAYQFRGQYMFGDDLLLAPVTKAVDPKSLLAGQRIWLPPGEWMEWFTGTPLQGPAQLERAFALDEIPVYARAGAIIPMQPKMAHTGEKPVNPLILAIFPGAAGETRIYDDDGRTPAYERGEAAWTTVRHSQAGDTRTIEILPVEGRYPGMAEKRAYEIRLETSWPPERVEYQGKALTFSPAGAGGSWRYDGDTLTAVIRLPESGVRERVELKVTMPETARAQTALLDGARARIARAKRAMSILGSSWPAGWSPDSLLALAQTGRRITLNPASALAELKAMNAGMPQVAEDIRKQPIECELSARALLHLGVNVACTPEKVAAAPGRD